MRTRSEVSHVAWSTREIAELAATIERLQRARVELSET